MIAVLELLESTAEGYEGAKGAATTFSKHP
jgi:hypothetical protein